MSLSLRLRLSRKRKPLLFFAFIATIILLQLGISYFLSKSKVKVSNYLSSTFGYKFYIEEVSFNFLHGISIRDISVYDTDQDKPPITIKDAFLSVELLPIFLKRTLAVKIVADEASLLINKQKEGMNLQVMFSNFYKKMPKPKILMPGILKNAIRISIRKTRIIYSGDANFEKNMYLLLKNLRIRQDSENFNFDAIIELNYRIPEGAYISKFLKNKDLKQLAKCSVQGKINEEDLIINLISLKIGEDQILGMGVNKGFAEKNPYLNINFIPSLVSLKNISYLKDNLNAKGYAYLSARLYGPMDNTKIGTSAKLEYCDFSYVSPSEESYEINDLNAEIEYRDNQIKLQDAYLRFNSFPLNIKLNVAVFGEPNFSLHLSFPKESLILRDIPLNKFDIILNGQISKTLIGDLTIYASYIRQGVVNAMSAHFKNIDFDYSNPNEKNLSATIVELIKEGALKTQKLTFTDLKSKVNIHKNGLEVKPIGLSGYNTILNGQINLDTQDKTTFNFILDTQGLAVKTLMQDISISDKLISGFMNANIVFDNGHEEFLKGACHIQNGTVDLDLLATIVKLPPLKNINFDTLDIAFSFTRNKLNIKKVKLLSRSILLDASWDINGNIEGVLNLKIASDLLNQSPSFRKLIRLTKINKPYIDLSFSLGGTPKGVRVMWMKGEFKDKIKEELPLWIKRRIENDLDKMIDDLSKK